jgi:hypothetical protein
LQGGRLISSSKITKKMKEDKVRKITVSERNYKTLKNFTGLKQVPKIKIQGNWLRELGFEIGQTLCIIATAGMITIKKEDTSHD